MPQPRNLNHVNRGKIFLLNSDLEKNVQIVISSATVVIMVDIQGQMRERFMNSKMFTRDCNCRTTFRPFHRNSLESIVQIEN